MIRFVVTFFLVCIVTLQGASDKELLAKAKKYVRSEAKVDQFRAYNDFKNLYLRALMKEDDHLRLSALQGIVKSGNKLHIDVSQYSEELDSLQSHYVPKIKKKQKTPLKKYNKKIQIQSSHKLQSIRWKNGRLVLHFDKKLRNNQINYFSLYDSKKKSYSYVFDVHASMLTYSETLQKQGIDSIKLVQFNPSTLRLTIQNRTSVAISFKKSSSDLIIKMTPKKTKQRYLMPQKKTAGIGTYECDAHANFKKVLLESTEDKIKLMSSPVGYPARGVVTNLTQLVDKREGPDIKCISNCVAPCNRGEEAKVVGFCIADRLSDAYEGNLETGLFFSGSNGYRLDKIISVAELLDKLMHGE